MPNDTIVPERPTGSATQASEAQPANQPSGPDWYLREIAHLSPIPLQGTGAGMTSAWDVRRPIARGWSPEVFFPDGTGLTWLWLKTACHAFCHEAPTDFWSAAGVPTAATSLVPRPVARREADDRVLAAATPAARLRALSHLDTTRLAGIFDVSRVAYQQWISKGTPQGGNGERLLEVLALVEEVAQRLGSPAAVRDWLLTPTSPGGKKPLELLTERRDHAFRGHLLRIASGKQRARSLPPSGRVRRPLSQEAFEDALERLRPRIPREEGAPDQETVTSRFMPEQEG